MIPTGPNPDTASKSVDAAPTSVAASLFPSFSTFAAASASPSLTMAVGITTASRRHQRTPRPCPDVPPCTDLLPEHPTCASRFRATKALPFLVFCRNIFRCLVVCQ